MRTVRDWEKALADVSSGEDSDEHDSLNVVKVQKNARRVSELLHTFVPGLDADRGGNVPKGMNRPDRFREIFQGAFYERLKAGNEEARALADSLTSFSFPLPPKASKPPPGEQSTTPGEQSTTPEEQSTTPEEQSTEQVATPEKQSTEQATPEEQPTPEEPKAEQAATPEEAGVLV